MSNAIYYSTQNRFTERFNLLNRNDSNTELDMVRSLGQNLVALVRGDLDAPDIVAGENVLRTWVTTSPCFEFFARELARIAGKISNRFPHINVLEIGKFTLFYFHFYFFHGSYTGFEKS